MSLESIVVCGYGRLGSLVGSGVCLLVVIELFYCLVDSRQCASPFLAIQLLFSVAGYQGRCFVSKKRAT